MSAGKGGPSNPIGRGPAPMPGQPSPGMPAQDPYNRPEATNLPRYAGQPGYPGTGPYTPRPDLGPNVGFGPGLPPQNNPPQDIPDSPISVGPGISPREFNPTLTPMPMPDIFRDIDLRSFDPINDPALAYSDGTTPGGKSGPSPGFRKFNDFIRTLPAMPQQQPGMQSPTGFAQPGVPFGPAGSPVTGQPVANRYTRTRTNPGNRFIPSNAPGR